jgi:hypothetical protein
MKKSLHLSIEKEAYSALKQRRINISKYVEKLVYKDLALSNNQIDSFESPPSHSIP